MRKVLIVLFFVVIFLNLVFSAWYVLHNDINFSSEIARDFFLLKEVSEKKIVLIGPSSSTGLFHGPLWTYVNYPAYFIGKGNPVVVGWYWIFLVIAFLISNYFIAKKLFDKTSAYFFVLMTSVYMVFHAYNFYNPHGAMFLLPAFFFFFVRYIQTRKLKFLLLHILLGSAVIQFQMAIGIPFMMLSFFYTLAVSVKHRKIFHMLSYLLTGILLGNFILFDMRHQFLISHLLLAFLTSAGRQHPSLFALLSDRLNMMLSSVEIIRQDPGFRNLFLFGALLVFLFTQIKDNKYKTVYLSFLYFYCGFFLLSLVNVGGPLLYFYLFPLFPFVFLIFSSFVTSRYKKAFVAIFFVVFAMNMFTVFQDTKTANAAIGESISSWKFLSNVTSKLYEEQEKEFGYFVYSPNVLAYEGKYAMEYAKNIHTKNAFYFQKKPTTYLIIAPPPQNNPDMKDSWWRENMLKLDATPTATIKFDNGYKIEKYNLTDEQIKIPFDPGIDPGLHFR